MKYEKVTDFSKLVMNYDKTINTNCKEISRFLYNIKTIYFVKSAHKMVNTMCNT